MLKRQSRPSSPGASVINYTEISSSPDMNLTRHKSYSSLRPGSFLSRRPLWFIILLFVFITLSLFSITSSWRSQSEMLVYTSTTYSFSHAVNSWSKLEAALKSSTNFLEADVLMHSTKGPIMAHPPATDSDLTLNDFLNEVMSYNRNMSSLKKAIKLDIKTQDALELLLDMLHEKWEGPLPWLNADIVAGPGDVSAKIDADTFISSCLKVFPESVLSLGWTVQQGYVMGYTSEMVDNMLKIIDHNNLSSHEVTFPVHAIHAMNSAKEMQRLLDYSPLFTLTVWGEADNTILEWLAAFAPGRAHVDVQPMRSKVWWFVNLGRAEERVKKKREERRASRKERVRERERLLQEREEKLKMVAEERQRTIEDIERRREKTCSKSVLSTVSLVVDLQSEYESAVIFHQRLMDDKTALEFIQDDLKESLALQGKRHIDVIVRVQDAERKLRELQNELRQQTVEQDNILANYHDQLRRRDEEMEGLSKEIVMTSHEGERNRIEAEIMNCMTYIGELTNQLNEAKQEKRQVRANIPLDPLNGRMPSVRCNDRAAQQRKREKEIKSRELESKLYLLQRKRIELEYSIDFYKKKVSDSKNEHFEKESQLKLLRAEALSLKEKENEGLNK
eukprot:Ihof_evm1s690 gene=Ihof_evmTU1s690